ncbi:MAG: hypothetical protein ACFFCE_09135 [Promethearchaeota archaeon]
MFQSIGDILDILSDPIIFRYLIGGIVVLVIIIVCCAIHRKLMED